MGFDSTLRTKPWHKLEGFIPRYIQVPKQWFQLITSWFSSWFSPHNWRVMLAQLHLYWRQTVPGDFRQKPQIQGSQQDTGYGKPWEQCEPGANSHLNLIPRKSGFIGAHLNPYFSTSRSPPRWTKNQGFNPTNFIPQAFPQLLSHWRPCGKNQPRAWGWRNPGRLSLRN